MKKIFYLLTIVVSLTTQAQISNYELCDTDNDGMETFDLYSKIPEALNGLDPQLYSVTFHETYDNAENYTNDLEQYFTNYSVPTQTIYVRIQNNTDETFTIETFELVPLPSPEIGQPINLFNPDGIFDLTDNSASILNGGSYVLTFHLALSDAEEAAFAIANPVNYTAVSSPQTIYVRAESLSGCYVVTSFHLFTGSDDIVYIPDTFFKTKLLQASATNQIAKDINGNNMIVDVNSDEEIQVSEALNVYWLKIEQSFIQNLTGIEAFVNLTHLYCSNNNIGELNLSNNINLIYLECYSNLLTLLDLSNVINLDYLSCDNNNLTELNLSNNINLTSLSCSSNYLTELDLSNNPNLETLWAINNPQLTHLNIKNGGNLDPDVVGSVSWMEIWANLPDNIYICADDAEIALIHPHLNIWGNTGQIVTSYCSFEPEGDYNTITGSVFYDFENNGCDENDVIQYTKININDGTEQGASFTNNEGNYLFFTETGEFILTPELENPTFFNVTPITETITFPDNNNNEEIVNFCITPNGVHNDLEVVIAPITPARPGFEATYKIIYRNKGNQVMSEDYGLNFFYNQNLMTFVSASVTPDTQGPGGMNWSYEDLLPFESREILVTMQINPPTDPENPVNIDDILTFTYVIMPQAGDENVMDNIYILNQTVVGAFDPNDITCIEGDVVDPEYIGEELHYVIRFENTGNFYAENVVIAMEIDEALYDVSSLRVLNASHNVRAQVRDNVAEFFFNQIYLDSGGHGNILLVMRSHTALEEGDSVLSKADIYFDYNYPIITNDAVTVFETTMSIEENIQNIDLKVYPNPTTDYFNLVSDSKIQSIELYDLSGRLIKTSLINDFETKQDITLLNKGTYILKIKTENGEITGKIIKN